MPGEIRPLANGAEKMFLPLRQLYPSEGNGNSTYNFDIVFFHGLQITGGDKAWESTWVSPGAGPDGKDVCWPREWLPQDFDNIRVLSASYDADATVFFGRGQTEDLEYIGENLTKCMKQYGIGQRKFVLVGHSLGGLVIKWLLAEANRLAHIPGQSPLDRDLRSTCNAFLNNLQGIVFYAVPHAGTEVASLVSYLDRLGLSKIMKDLMPFNKRMQKLSVLTVDAFNDRPISIKAFTEGQKTLGQIVVPEASAMQLAGNHHYHLQDRNHSQVCKPPYREHPSYTQLKEFLVAVGVEPMSRPRNERSARAATDRIMASSSNLVRASASDGTTPSSVSQVRRH